MLPANGTNYAPESTVDGILWSQSAAGEGLQREGGFRPPKMDGGDMSPSGPCLPKDDLWRRAPGSQPQKDL